MSDYSKGKIVAWAIFGGFIGALIMGAIAYMMPIPNTGGAPFFVAAAMLMGMGPMSYVAGWALHILTGIIVGAIFGVAIATVHRLNITSIGKGIALGTVAGAVVWLVFFMPMMAMLMPALVGMSMMVAGSFFAHLVFGIAMGGVASRAVHGKLDGHPIQ